MNKNIFFSLIFFISLFLFNSCLNKEKTNKRPNILFIMTDDHASQAISAYKSNLINTPNIDKIAEEGIRFDNCYATNALCGPSRACILTGKLSHINGFTDNASIFNGNQPTFPQMLQKAGYQTFMLGKWHLISKPQGFNYYCYLTGQNEQGNYYNPVFNENGKKIEIKGYTTDIVTDKVIECLKNRKKNKPFCMLYHQKAPHRNWMPAPRHIGIFDDTIFPEPDNLFDDYKNMGTAAKQQDLAIANTLRDDWDLKLKKHENILKDTTSKYYKVYSRMSPEVMAKWDSVYSKRYNDYKIQNKKGKDLISWKYQQYMRDYLSTVLAVDENIGRVINYLEETGELDNTIVIYTSDQGFFLGQHGWFDKRFMYEESSHMPFIVRYPKAIKPASVTDALAMNIDFAPTLLDYAGVDIPNDIQGRSLRPIFENNKQELKSWRDYAYYHYYEFPAEHSVKRHYGIRTKRYKLIHFYNDIDEWELYDLQNDPKEMNNVYADKNYSEIVNQLKNKLIQVQKEYKDTDPCEKQKELFHGDRRFTGRKK